MSKNLTEIQGEAAQRLLINEDFKIIWAMVKEKLEVARRDTKRENPDVDGIKDYGLIQRRIGRVSGIEEVYRLPEATETKFRESIKSKSQSLGA